MANSTLKSILPEKLRKGITPAERIVWKHVQEGKIADLSSGSKVDDNPENSKQWGKQRIVRTEFLFWLCTNSNACTLTHAKGVRIVGVKVNGALDFAHTVLPHPLVLVDCDLSEGIILTDSRTRSLNFSGSCTDLLSANSLKVAGNVHLKGLHAKGVVRLLGADISGQLNCIGATLKNPGGVALSADGLKVAGDVFLKDGFLAEGEVRLLGADIGGHLDCTGATLKNPRGKALSADGFKVASNVFLKNSFLAEGAVRLLGAEIGGQLSCTGATLKNPGGDALSADGLKVAGDVFLKDGFLAEGEVRLLGADIGGQLNCTGATLKNPKGDALSADRLKVVNSVFLGELHAEGAVRLLGADIGGQLNCTGATLKNPKGDALSADNLKVTNGVLLNDGFLAEGEVRLLGADIGGQLNCTGANLKNPGGVALIADSLKVTGEVFLKGSFLAEGMVRLLGADISGQLSCIGATLKNPKDKALCADGLKVTGDVFLKDGFLAEGEVLLLGANIGGQLDCTGATLKNISGDAFSAEGMQVGGALFWRLQNKPQGAVNLMHARVGLLVDDEKSWPDRGKLFLDGFEYKAFAGGAPQTATERLRWLQLQPQKKGLIWLQPYEQLAGIFHGNGHESDARTVLIAKQEDLRRYGRLSRLAKVWNWFLGKTIGHGYKPWKVFFPIGFMVLVGWSLFTQADRLGVMQPSKEVVYLNSEFIRTNKIPDRYPRFSAFIYSIDTFFPFVNLHQEDYWLPSVSKPSGYSFKYYLWFHIGMGWLLSTFAIAALTGLIRNSRPNNVD